MIGEQCVLANKYIYQQRKERLVEFMLASSNIAATSEEKFVALPLNNKTSGLAMRCSFTQISSQHSKLYVRLLETYLYSGHTVVLL